MGYKLTLHVFSALFALITVILPLIGLTLAKLYRIQVIKRASFLIKILRMQNIMLLLTVISGYLIWGGFFINWWILTVLGFTLLYGAVLSFMKKSLKNLIEKAQSNISYEGSIKNFIGWSLFNTVIVIGLFVFKLY